METFPAYYPLAGKRVVIAGDGPPAEAKARLFAGSPAEVARVLGAAALHPAAYAGADLIFVTSFDPAFRAAAARAARQCGAPINVADAPELSDFHTPAIVDRGQVVAAIGTAGAAPLLASLLRADIEARVPAGAGRIAELLGARREALLAAFPDLPARRSFLRAVLAGPAARAALDGDLDLAGRRLDDAIAAGWAAVGQVSLIEAPEADDLISLRAMRALNTADVVVAGEAAQALIASHARRDAEHLAPIDAGAEALAALAAAGRRVAVIVPCADVELIEVLRARDIAVEALSSATAL